jgi:hypothetical protein
LGINLIIDPWSEVGQSTQQFFRAGALRTSGRLRVWSDA